MEILGEYGLLVHFSSALVPLGDARFVPYGFAFVLSTPTLVPIRWRLTNAKIAANGDFYSIVGTGVLDCPF